MAVLAEHIDPILPAKLSKAMLWHRAVSDFPTQLVSCIESSVWRRAGWMSPSWTIVQVVLEVFTVTRRVNRYKTSTLRKKKIEEMKALILNNSLFFCSVSTYLKTMYLWVIIRLRIVITRRTQSNYLHGTTEVEQRSPVKFWFHVFPIIRSVTETNMHVYESIC